MYKPHPHAAFSIHILAVFSKRPCQLTQTLVNSQGIHKVRQREGLIWCYSIIQRGEIEAVLQLLHGHFGCQTREELGEESWHPSGPQQEILPVAIWGEVSSGYLNEPVTGPFWRLNYEPIPEMLPPRPSTHSLPCVTDDVIMSLLDRKCCCQQDGDTIWSERLFMYSTRCEHDQHQSIFSPLQWKKWDLQEKYFEIECHIMNY